MCAVAILVILISLIIKLSYLNPADCHSTHYLERYYNIYIFWT